MRIITRREPVPVTRLIQCHTCKSVLEVTEGDVRLETPDDGIYPGNTVFRCAVCNANIYESKALFVVAQVPVE